LSGGTKKADLSTNTRVVYFEPQKGRMECRRKEKRWSREGTPIGEIRILRAL